MINDNDLYWLAGIIDGEGFFTTNKRHVDYKRNGHDNIQLSFVTRIGIGNTDMEMIKRVSEIYCELGAKFWYCLHNPDKRFPHAKKYVSINVEGYRSTKKILLAIIDKLVTTQKKAQAELMLKYIDYRLELIGTRIIRNDDGKNDIKFAEELKALKNYQISPSTTKRVASTPLTW